MSSIPQEARWNAMVGRAEACTACELHKSATCRVIADPRSWAGRRPIVFVGEGPGENEDLQGLPFVGLSGKFLRQQIERVGFKDYRITNAVQCRPPSNRQPLPHEIRRCRPFLFEKLLLIDPEVVVALGGTAAMALLEIDMISISSRVGTYERRTMRYGGEELSFYLYFVNHPRWGMSGNRDRYTEQFDELREWSRPLVP